MKHVMLILTVILIPSAIFAQGLKELQWEEATGVSYLSDHRTQSLLIVESTVPHLSFESNKGIKSVVLKESGIWHVLLDPGPQVVTIRAEGYLPLVLPSRPAYQARQARKIRVTPKPVIGAAGGFDADRPELKLHYTPSSTDEEVFVQLDDNPPQKMNFAGGTVVLRPAAGKHTVRAFSGGRVWETTLTLESGTAHEETLNFTSKAVETLEKVLPGNLFIESDPPGATVFLNTVEQEGKTPLTLNDLRPGTYEIEVVAELHLPANRVVKVRELDYTTVEVELTPNYGQLKIDSEPSGALIYINDRQRGTTPLEIPRFNAGRYSVRLVQQLYHEVTDTFSIEPGVGFTHTYELRPQFGSLTVTSDPPGAEVEVDGARWGTTPVTREQVISGTHQVRVSKEYYFPQEKQVEIFDGMHRDLPFLLSPSVGYLDVSSTPSGATVTIVETGELLGTTPLQEVALDPGTYTLRLELDRYETVERTLPVSLAGTTPVKVELRRKTGHIRLETDPPKATVILDGEWRGTTPTVLRAVPTGEHTLRLEKKGYDTRVSEAVVYHNEISDIFLTLGTEGTEKWLARRKRARLLAFIPGAGQIASPGQWWRGGLYIGGMAVTGFLAYRADSSYHDAKTDYHRALDDYKQASNRQETDESLAEAASAQDRMDTAKEELKIFLAAAGGIYAISLIDAWLFGGGAKPVKADPEKKNTGVKPYMTTSGNKLNFGVQVKF